MNKGSIKTYEDLTVERDRLKALLIIQKQRVVNDWDAVKAEFEPVSNTFGELGKFTRPDKSNPMLTMGLKFASDILLKNFVLAKAGWVTRLAVPFVMKNYSSHLFAENGRGILDKVRNFGSIFKSRKHKRYEPEHKDSQYRGAGQNSELGPLGV